MAGEALHQHLFEDEDDDEDPWPRVEPRARRMALFISISNLLVALVLVMALLDPLGLWEEEQKRRTRDPWDIWGIGPVTPVITLEVVNSTPTQHIVRVLRVGNALGENIDLAAFKYDLGIDGGLVFESGEIALQNISGDWHGIDVTWDDKGFADINPGNGQAERARSAGGPYTDRRQPQIRIEAVQSGFQEDVSNQKSEGLISVSFTDNDRDGDLSAGDVFHVETYDGDGTGPEGLILRLIYDITDEVSATLHLSQ